MSLLGGLALTLAVAAYPANAAATTVSVGADLTRSFDLVPFDGQRTLTNTVASSTGNLIAAPFNGTVRRWSVVGVTGGPVNLKVVRPFGGGLFTGGGSLTSGPITDAGVHTFTSGIAVKAGDLFGVDPTDPTHSADTIGIDHTDPQASYSYWWPRLTTSSPPTAPAESGVDGQIGVSVVIESNCVVPKLKRLKLPAARDALAAANCKLGKIGRPRKRKLRGKANVIIAQDARAGTELPGGTPVGVHLGRKSQFKAGRKK